MQELCGSLFKQWPTIHNMFTSSAGHLENMIGFPGGYSRVEQLMPLLLPGCKRNTDDIFDIELSATIQQKHLKQ